MSPFERPRSLTELVAEHLRRDIVTGALEFGEALSEATIARRLDVSRTPVREAFARLEIEGLVRSAPQRGTFVFSMTREQLIAICDVRLILEAGAIRLGVERGARAYRRPLDAVTARMRKARERDDRQGYLALDTIFHATLIEGAGNAYLREAYRAIAPRMAALRSRLGDHPDHMAKSFDEHLRIAALLGEGEVEAAIDVLTSHIGRKEGSYWNICAPPAAADKPGPEVSPRPSPPRASDRRRRAD